MALVMGDRVDYCHPFSLKLASTSQANFLFLHYFRVLFITMTNTCVNWLFSSIYAPFV